MREQLVSYLLGELDDAQAAELEAKLASDPDLRRQLERLRSCMNLEQDALRQTPQADSGDDPPTGLADRTADSVHDLVLGLESNSSATVATATDSIDPPGRRSSFTFVDAAVAAGVVMAVGMMLFPAIGESREASRRLACQNNLRKIGIALQQYAEAHEGAPPHILPGENAGMFAVRLADGGYIDRDDLSRSLVCRSSDLGEQVAQGGMLIRLPRADQLAELDAAALALVRRLMGGSYAYRLGYLDGPLYLPVRDNRRSFSPLLSDAPSPAAGRWQSLNHGGCGQNVLFRDGSVSYRVDCLMLDDNLFTNADGDPAASRSWNDAVLVGSEVTPGVLPSAKPRVYRATIWRIAPRTQSSRTPAP